MFGVSWIKSKQLRKLYERVELLLNENIFLRHEVKRLQRELNKVVLRAEGALNE
jgi:hypothetical protein